MVLNGYSSGYQNTITRIGPMPVSQKKNYGSIEPMIKLLAII